MRVHLTDGTRTVEIETRTATLADIEAAALRLLAALGTEPADDEQQRAPIGFTPKPDLDRIALSADTERADQDERPERYTEWGDNRT
ncbi:hypothetical protein EES45_22995 [Streptomyces sp. ADI97-07]|uniref:hypothetical protein n=1 Tax=Streptomyces sp. ADI97-07 TaxID=1522762 RepID=UPI000F54FF55|nr:hypothetical protein [Streptomyces sp. ADI97-07]RPK76630.1 hypothetical protein EES45_22995 [Streptomyces sp. ADI97-07]